MIYHSVACGKGTVAMVTQSLTGTRGGEEKGWVRVNPGRPLPTHTHAASDQDYKRDSVQGLTYKVMESRAGDIRGRAALTGVNKITVDTGGQREAADAHLQ